MQIKDWLLESSGLLEKESGTAQLDAEVMLAHVLSVDRSWLHAHPEHIIPKDKLDLLRDYITRRSNHEPLAYILESVEFYGRKFYITNGVLVPRPESETMIDLSKKYLLEISTKDLVLVDLGTGSGALAVTASLELSAKDVTAIDIDEKCLEIAKINTDKFGLNIHIKKGNLLEPIIGINLANKNLAILANLPYVPEKYSINSEAQNEPSHAIFGGEDGLDLYRKMFKQLDKVKSDSTTVFTESLPFQHQSLAEIASAHGFNLKESEDFIQVFIR